MKTTVTKEQAQALTELMQNILDDIEYYTEADEKELATSCVNMLHGVDATLDALGITHIMGQVEATVE